jgi:hypothetical protein
MFPFFSVVVDRDVDPKKIIRISADAKATGPN